MPTVDPHPNNRLPAHVLGQILLSHGLVERTALTARLRSQRRLRRKGIDKPLGALLIDKGCLTEEQLAWALNLQRHRREQAGPAPVRLSLREHNVLGEIVIASGVLDESTLERCRELQAAHRARGVEKKISEILIEEKLLTEEMIQRALAAPQQTDQPPSTSTRFVPPEFDQAFLKAVERSSLLAPAAVEKLRRLQGELGLLEVHRSLGELTCDSQALSIELLDKVARQVQRNFELEQMPCFLTEPLNPVEGRILLQYLKKHGRLTAAAQDRGRRVVELYLQYGIVVNLGEALIQAGLVDRAEVYAARQQTQQRARMTNLYHGVETRRRATSHETGQAAHHALRVVRCPARQLIGHKFFFDDSGFLIGRGVVRGLQLDHPGVSKTHARISVNSGVVLVEDLGSLTGTWVDRQRVARSVLRKGQTLTIGETVLQLIEHGVRAASASDPTAPGGTIEATAELLARMADEELGDTPLGMPSEDSVCSVNELVVIDLLDAQPNDFLTEPATKSWANDTAENPVLPASPADAAYETGEHPVPAIQEVRRVFREFRIQQGQVEPDGATEKPETASDLPAGIHQSIGARRVRSPRGALLLAAGLSCVIVGLLTYKVWPEPNQFKVERTPETPPAPVRREARIGDHVLLSGFLERADNPVAAAAGCFLVRYEDGRSLWVSDPQRDAGARMDSLRGLVEQNQRVCVSVRGRLVLPSATLKELDDTARLLVRADYWQVVIRLAEGAPGLSILSREN